MLRGIFRSEDHGAEEHHKSGVISKEDMKHNSTDLGKTLVDTATEAFRKLSGQHTDQAAPDFPCLNDYGKDGDPEFELDVERFVGEGGSADIEKEKDDHKGEKVVAVRYPLIRNDEKKPSLKRRVFAMRSVSESSPPDKNERARWIADREGHIFAVSMEEQDLKLKEEEQKKEPPPRKTSWDRQWLDEKAKELTDAGRHFWSTTQETFGMAAERAREGAQWAAEEAYEIGEATGEAANRVVDNLYDEEPEQGQNVTPASVVTESGTTEIPKQEEETITHRVSDVVHAVIDTGFDLADNISKGAKVVAEGGMHIAVDTAKLAYEGAEVVAKGLREAEQDAVSGVNELLNRELDDADEYRDDDDEDEYHIQQDAMNFSPDPLDVPSSFPRPPRRPVRPPTPPRTYPKIPKQAIIVPPVPLRTNLPDPAEAHNMKDRAIFKPDSVERSSGPLETPEGARMDPSQFTREHRPSPPAIPKRRMTPSEAAVAALAEFGPIPPIGKVPTGPLSAQNALERPQPDAGQPPSYASVAAHNPEEPTAKEAQPNVSNMPMQDCRTTMKQNEGDSFHHGPLPHLF